LRLRNNRVFVVDEQFTLIGPPVFHSAVYCVFAALDSDHVQFISSDYDTFEVRFVPYITQKKLIHESRSGERGNLDIRRI